MWWLNDGLLDSCSTLVKVLITLLRTKDNAPQVKETVAEIQRPDEKILEQFPESEKLVNRREALEEWMHGSDLRPESLADSVGSSTAMGRKLLKDHLDTLPIAWVALPNPRINPLQKVAQDAATFLQQPPK